MHAFAAEQSLIKEGKPVDALIALARLMTDHNPPASELADITCTALIASLEHPQEMEVWTAEAKSACYKTLLLHPVSPPPLAKHIAKDMTGDSIRRAKLLVHELTPTLRALCDQDLFLKDPADPGIKNLILFLLTIRAISESVITSETLSRLHLAWFSEFSPEDRTLPYSVMFNAQLFGQNRDELLAHIWPVGSSVADTPAFGPAEVLFFEWLAGRDAFIDHDNTDLARFLETHLPNPAKIPAARMLVLRHWRKGGRLSVETLALLGLGDILPLAEEAAQTRRARAASQTSKTTDLLHNRPYQAVHAGWNRVTLTLPFLNTGQRRVKVAMCLSGQLRGYEAALATWRKTILAHVDAKFFIHSWSGIGRSDGQPWRNVLPFEGAAFTQAYRDVTNTQGYKTIHARYPSLFAALNAGTEASVDTLKDLYSTDHVILEDDKGGRFSAFSNQQKMHYKIHAANQMAVDHAEFDLHVRIRPDLEVKLAGFNWRDLRDACQTRPLLFAEKPYGMHYGGLFIGDQCAIAAPATMASYANTWTKFPHYAQAGLAGCPADFKGHISLAIASWIGGLEVAKAPIRFGALQDARPLARTDILSALEKDTQGSATDQRLLDAIHADL